MGSGLGKAWFAFVDIDMDMGMSMYGYLWPSTLSSLLRMMEERKISCFHERWTMRVRLTAHAYEERLMCPSGRRLV